MSSVGGVTPKKILKEAMKEVSAEIVREPMEPGGLVVGLDAGVPWGTSVRVEIAPDDGLMELKLLTLTTDPEVQAEVYVVSGNVESRLLSLPGGFEVEFDIDEVFGELRFEKLVLVVKTEYGTSDFRYVTLKYSGSIYKIG